MNEETPKPKRTTLKLVLAGIAIVGVGAAITTAVWTDNVFFSATATASSFDLQGRQADPDAWQDVGIPGDSDTTPITLSTAELSALSPSETVTSYWRRMSRTSSNLS